MLLSKYRMFSQFAQSSCTVNGNPVDCDDFFGPVTTLLTAFGVFLLFFIFVSILGLIFWVLSLIHLFIHEDVDERIIWILLVLLVPFMQFIYFFGPRRTYEKRRSAAGELAPDEQKQ